MSQLALEAARQQTRQLARRHYENFVVASVLLPRRLRQPFYDLYAFCRTADDAADESPSPELALSQLADLQSRLDSAFSGQSCEGLFLALADTIRRFELPKQPFDDLLSAFRQDQTKSRYASFDELVQYCQRSANPVGRLVLCLAGDRTAPSCTLSDEICTGLQLANLWQDVARDFRMGRIYLPREEMDRWGVSEQMFSANTTAEPLRGLLRSECDRAASFFRRGLPLADRVPRWLSADIRLFVHGGLATLDAIGRIRYDVLRVRPTVSRVRQSGLVIRAMMGLL